MKMKRLVLLILLVLSASLLSVGCKKDNVSTTNPSISINKSEISLCVYQTETLSANYTGMGTLSWASSNSSIVTVNNGEVVAKSVGQATVTVSDGAVSATCSVTVNPLDITGLSYIGNESVKLYVGQSKTLAVQIKFAGNFINVPAFLYASSDESVVSVSQSGTIVANKIGSATVSLTTAIGGFETGCSVTVDVIPDGAVSTGVELIEIDSVSGEGLQNTYQVNAKAYDRGIENPIANINYLSSDEQIFTVSNSGLITAVSSGVATLTVQYSSTDGVDISDSVKVCVNKVNVVLNKDIGEIFITETLQADFESIIGDYEGEVNSVFVKNGEVLIPVGLSDNELDFSGVNVYGAQKLVFVTEKAEYEVSTEIWTARITNLTGMLKLYDATNGWYKIQNDVNMLGMEWEPVDGKIFSGVLDGENNTIKNFSINGSYGLFKNIGSGAIIKNISFEGLEMSSSAVLSGVVSANVMYTNSSSIQIENVKADIVIYGQQCGGLFGSVASGTNLILKDVDLHTFAPDTSIVNGALVGKGSLTVETENVFVCSSLSACGDGTDIGVEVTLPIEYSRDIKMSELAKDGYAEYDCDASIGSTVSVYGRTFETKIVSTAGKFILTEDVARTCVGKNVEILVRTANGTLESYFTINLLPEYHIYRRNITILRELDSGIVTLKEDIDMNGITWEKYVYKAHPNFSGTFDGDGHVIKNFNMAGNTGEASIALFYNLVGTETQPAVVKNVAFVDATVTSGNAVIATRATNAHFENVFISIKSIVNGSAGAVVSANEKMSVKNVYVSMPDLASVSATRPSSYLTGLYSRYVAVENLMVSGGNVATGGTLGIVTIRDDIDEIVVGSDGTAETLQTNFVQYKDALAFADKVNKKEVTVDKIIEDSLFTYSVIKITKSNITALRDGGNKFYMLAEDIDMSDVTWEQYGANDYKTNIFSGVFDGMGYTISNFTTVGGNHVGGLFCHAKTAVIRNLIMTDVTVSGSTGILAARAGHHLGGTSYIPFTIENVVIKVKSSSGTASCAIAAASYQVDIKNSIIDMSACTTGKFIATTYSQSLIANNVYLIGSLAIDTNNTNSFSGITKFADYNSFASANKTLNEFLTTAVTKVYA